MRAARLRSTSRTRCRSPPSRCSSCAPARRGARARCRHAARRRLLALAESVKLARYQRGALLDALAADYITTARGKGLGPRGVVAHALRNALLPTVTLVGSELPALLSAAVIVEQVFGLHGIGRLAFDAVLTRDVPLLLGITTVGAVVTLAAVLAADLAYGLVDPRAARYAPRERTGGASRRRRARAPASASVRPRARGPGRRPHRVRSAARRPQPGTLYLLPCLTRPAALDLDAPRAAHDWLLPTPIPYGPRAAPGRHHRRPVAARRAHWLGTDDRGRDVAARLVHGAASPSPSVRSPSRSTSRSASPSASPPRSAAAADFVIGRVVDVGLLFPTLLLLRRRPGRDLATSLAEVALRHRADAVAVRGAAHPRRGAARRAPAARRGRARRRRRRARGSCAVHILPLAATPALTAAAFGIGHAVLFETRADFLGFGVPPPTASWGELLAQAQASGLALAALPPTVAGHRARRARVQPRRRRRARRIGAPALPPQLDDARSRRGRGAASAARRALRRACAVRARTCHRMRTVARGGGLRAGVVPSCCGSPSNVRGRMWAAQSNRRARRDRRFRRLVATPPPTFAGGYPISRRIRGRARPDREPSREDFRAAAAAARAPTAPRARAPRPRARARRARSRTSLRGASRLSACSSRDRSPPDNRPRCRPDRRHVDRA